MVRSAVQRLNICTCAPLQEFTGDACPSLHFNCIMLFSCGWKESWPMENPVNIPCQRFITPVMACVGYSWILHCWLLF